MTPQIWFLFLIIFMIVAGIVGFFIGRWYEVNEEIIKLLNKKRSK